MGIMADGLAWFRKAVKKAVVKSEVEDLHDELHENNLSLGENQIEREHLEERNREIKARLHALSCAERRVPRPIIDQFDERHPAMAEILRNMERPYLAEVRPIRTKETA
jgi:hypothetical protein